MLSLSEFMAAVGQDVRVANTVELSWLSLWNCSERRLIKVVALLYKICQHLGTIKKYGDLQLSSGYQQVDCDGMPTDLSLEGRNILLLTQSPLYLSQAVSPS
jgi:hypothetical protein